MKRFLFILAILLTTGTGCSLPFQSDGGQMDKASVSLKWKHQAQFAGMYVAQEDGIYRKRGLDVYLKELDFTSAPIDDLMTGKSDFAIMSAEEFLFHVDEGKDLVAVATIYQISPYALVSLAKDAINAPKDFAGKVLGTKGGKIEEEIIYKLLAATAGISPKDVNIVKVGTKRQEVDDLRQGYADVIDLYRTDQLFFFDKEGVEYSLIKPERYGVNIHNDVIVTRRDILETRPDFVRSFLHGTVLGWKEVIKKPQEAVSATLMYVTDDAYKSRKYQEFILNNSLPLIQPTPKHKIGYMTYVQWSDIYRALREYNIIKNDFDVVNTYTNEFLP